MKSILRKHPEAILAFISLVFVGAIVYAFMWGIGDVVGAVSSAAGGANNNGASAGFDLQSAHALNLRGLVK